MLRRLQQASDQTKRRVILIGTTVAALGIALIWVITVPARVAQSDGGSKSWVEAWREEAVGQIREAAIEIEQLTMPTTTPTSTSN